MTNQNDLPERVTRLERQIKKCRVDSAAARVLASAADRDVAEFRTTYRCSTSVLNALRETQLEHGEKLKQHDARFDQLEAKFDTLDGKFSTLDGKFDTLDAKFSTLDGKFDTLDAEFSTFDDKFDTLDVKFDTLEARMTNGFSTLALGQAQITALLKFAIGQPDEEID